MDGETGDPLDVSLAIHPPLNETDAHSRIQPAMEGEERGWHCLRGHVKP